MYHALLFDEAHHVEGAAARYLTVESSYRTVARLARLLRVLSAQGGPLHGGQHVRQHVEGMAQQLEHAAAQFFSSLDDGVALFAERLREPLGIDDDLSPVLRDTAANLELFAEVAVSDEDRQAINSLRDRLTELAAQTEALLTQSGGDSWVYWIDRSGRAEAQAQGFVSYAALAGCPVNLEQSLRENLFEQIPVSFVSATLSSTAIRRVGCDEFAAQQFHSPFDYAANALLSCRSRPSCRPHRPTTITSPPRCGRWPKRAAGECSCCSLPGPRWTAATMPSLMTLRRLATRA